MFSGPPVVQSPDLAVVHYATTERDMAEPFLCHCGSKCCASQIRGFRWLANEERQRLRTWLAAHLLARFDAR